jgi:hypothetical protein
MQTYIALDLDRFLPSKLGLTKVATQDAHQLSSDYLTSWAFTWGVCKGLAVDREWAQLVYRTALSNGGNTVGNFAQLKSTESPVAKGGRREGGKPQTFGTAMPRVSRAHKALLIYHTTSLNSSRNPVTESWLHGGLLPSIEKNSD